MNLRAELRREARKAAGARDVDAVGARALAAAELAALDRMEHSNALHPAVLTAPGCSRSEHRAWVGQCMMLGIDQGDYRMPCGCCARWVR